MRTPRHTGSAAAASRDDDRESGAQREEVALKVRANHWEREHVGQQRPEQLGGSHRDADVLPAKGATGADLQAALGRLPGVGSVEPASAATRTLQESMGQFGNVLRIAWIFGLASRS